MIHAKTEEELNNLIKEMVEEVKLEKFEILKSLLEFKKERVKYFNPEFYKYEKEVEKLI